MHRAAFCPVFVWWGLGKSLLRIRVIENKKCSPEKVSIISYFQINILPTQFWSLSTANLVLKRDTGRPPINKKAYDLYSALLTECHVLDRYEIKKEDAVLKQTHVHSTLLGLWLSRGL